MRPLQTVLYVLFRRVVAAVGILFAAAALLLTAGALEMVGPSLALSPVPPASSPPLGKMSVGDTVARIAVPRLGYEAPVREGADAETLSLGPGHVPGTALPGEESGRKHAVIAFARDAGSEFAARLALGDIVELRTPFGLRVYRVVRRTTMKPQDVRVEPTREPTLTFVTPYPADSVGPAPLRLTVRAEPVSDAFAAASSRTSSATDSIGQSRTGAGGATSRTLPAGR
jgi:LPXTG-site transpeptidase (sortase) family protein